MKKLANKSKAQAIKMAKRRGAQKALERQRRHERHVDLHRRPDVPLDGRTLVVCPRILKLTGNDAVKKSIRFFRRIYRASVEQRGYALVDLSSLENASAPALTVLAAEITRCLEVRPNSVGGIAPSDRGMAYLLDRYGVSSALGLKAVGDENAKGVLRIRTGLAEEIRRTEFLDRFLEPILPGDS
ncbi:MAG: hypothetical protein U1A07_25205, partial [Phenylobacterium sp.]|nr:hypothetical protein [Phenylobacterium sp.]